LKGGGCRTQFACLVTLHVPTIYSTCGNGVGRENRLDLRRNINSITKIAFLPRLVTNRFFQTPQGYVQNFHTPPYVCTDNKTTTKYKQRVTRITTEGESTFLHASDHNVQNPTNLRLKKPFGSINVQEKTPGS